MIDYSTSNPMCLWSAALSYVRPAPAPSFIRKLKGQAKGSFGLGSSLYMIDLRSNTGTFQWSPSAEEFTVEGVHSISGLLTDWTRDNKVWVTSTSAGKTWEIDGRMPCRAVTTWSLTSNCEPSSGMTLSSKGFHGENSLLTPTLSYSGNTDVNNNHLVDNGPPLVKVDTEFGTTGIHMFQGPLNGPRFQTDSVETIATPGIDFSKEASIATSSYFALPDVRDDSYICGLTSLRLPIEQFVGADETVWKKYRDHNSNILCNLIMTNNGDIYSYSSMETHGNANDESRRFDNLPVGTKAIVVPKELDGIMKLLKHGHWKPTCGMNIQLFLTNSYPLSRSATLIYDENDGKNKEIVLKSAKRKKIDESDDVLQIQSRKPQTGISINPETDDHVLFQNEEFLEISQTLLRQSNKKMEFQTRKKGSNDDGNDRNTPKHSDLSATEIHQAIQAWDETATADLDSEEDDDR